METLLSIDREMKDIDNIARVPDRTRRKVLKFLEKGGRLSL